MVSIPAWLGAIVGVRIGIKRANKRTINCLVHRSGFANPDRAGRGRDVVMKKGANLGESGVYMPAPDVQ